MVGEKGLLYNKSKEIFNEKIFKDAMPEGIWRKVAADDEVKVMFLKNPGQIFLVKIPRYLGYK